MTVTVLRADARQLPIPDSSVDLIVTSPPYFALRSYQDGGEHYAGQVGAEPTPAAFVDALIEVTRECVRVLKPTGSLWVNLGDKYASTSASVSSNGTGATGLTGGTPLRDRDAAGVARRITSGVPQKSLIGIPWRYALACIDDLGLILRAEVIWSKPNGLPESVTDRVRRSHEQWFHFTLQPRYFSAVDEIREAQTSFAGFRGHAKVYGPAQRQDDGRNNIERTDGLGKLPGSVWTVPTEPLKVPEHLGVDHFAAFPTEWPRRIVQGWSPSGVCVECGEGRRPVIDATRSLEPGRQSKGLGKTFAAGSVSHHPGDDPEPVSGLHMIAQRTITGYACACPEPNAPTRPSVVLDPFGGTGTTAHVAHALGRHGITVDLSADYCRIANDPTVQDGRLRKVLGVEKVPAEIDGQADLFGEWSA